MSCAVLTKPSPLDEAPGCTTASLRLIEHYELDYLLALDPTNDPPYDGEEVAARRWNSYYCTACHAGFTSRLLAFAHVGEGSAPQLNVSRNPHHDDH